MRISSKWFLDLHPNEHEAFKKTVLSYHTDPVLRQLKKIIQAKIDELSKSNPQDYDNNSWAYYQADKNGQQRALEEINQLLSTVEK
jgi:hypothetical protein